MKRMKKLFAFITAIVMIFTIWQPATTFAAAKKSLYYFRKNACPDCKKRKRYQQKCEHCLERGQASWGKRKSSYRKNPKRYLLYF